MMLILVVQNDPFVSAVTSKVPTDADFKVVEASHALEALDLRIAGQLCPCTGPSPAIRSAGETAEPAKYSWRERGPS